jgi:hypothetical protein
MLSVLRIPDRLPRRGREHLAISEREARRQGLHPVGFAAISNEDPEVGRGFLSRHFNFGSLVRHLVAVAMPRYDLHLFEIFVNELD